VTSDRAATVIQDEDAVQGLLDALDDADCRTILDVTGEGALTASEVSETCDLPLSTAYRKLELLTEAGLVEERTRIRRSGKHASEYRRVVTDVVVSLDTGEGLALRLVPEPGREGPAPVAAER
jgi:predicted transcriptional regulator